MLRSVLATINFTVIYAYDDSKAGSMSNEKYGKINLLESGF